MHVEAKNADNYRLNTPNMQVKQWPAHNEHKEKNNFLKRKKGKEMTDGGKETI